MGWFSNLFSKKPGGSVFGNILRAVGDHFTGGLYSTINPQMSCKAEPNSFAGCGGDYSWFRSPHLENQAIPDDVNKLMNETFDFLAKGGDYNQISQETINTIDSHLGVDMPLDLQNKLGMDEDLNIVDPKQTESALNQLAETNTLGGIKLTEFVRGGSSDPSKLLGFGVIAWIIYRALNKKKRRY